MELQICAIIAGAKKREIFYAIDNGNFEKVKDLVAEDPKIMEGRWDYQTPLSFAIAHGKLEIAQFLWEKCGRVMIESDDSSTNPVPRAAVCGHLATLKWAFEEKVLSPDTLINSGIKHNAGLIPLDYAIVFGQLDIAQFLWENGRQFSKQFNKQFINVRRYHIFRSHIYTFHEQILPIRWSLFDFEHVELARSTSREISKNVSLFQKRIYVDPVFLAMQRAKRDHQCVLCRLPNELLDMVVDEVAARFRLKVEW